MIHWIRNRIFNFTSTVDHFY